MTQINLDAGQVAIVTKGDSLELFLPSTEQSNDQAAPPIVVLMTAFWLRMTKHQDTDFAEELMTWFETNYSDFGSPKTDNEDGKTEMLEGEG